jgi:ABC-2 type transport system ATP-binding protein
MSPAIRTESLSKRFGAVRALHQLDLRVETGEVFGYLGPNGAGKTTTIRLLLDFIRPTSGRCEVLGGSGADPAVRRRIGYLPADLPVDPRYTSRDLLDFYGRLRGRTEPAWVDELLARFDLDPTRPFGELSTGNRRKLGIVQAVAHRPDLLLLDEPSSGLDPLLQHQFQQLIRELSQAGVTVFLSSHVLPEVEALAGRVAILRRGELVTVAGIDELRRQARQRIDLHLAGPEPGDVARFAGVPGVVEAAADGPTIRLTVEGPVRDMLKVAADLDVIRIVSHNTDLEEVFLSYYQQDRT